MAQKLFQDPDFYVLLILVGLMLAGLIRGIYHHVRRPDMPQDVRDWRVPYGGWILVIIVTLVTALLVMAVLKDPLER